MRWEELVALRPRHVDLPQCLIVVRETIVEISKKNSPTGERYQVKGYPKSNKPRIIKIGQELTELISDRINSLGMGPEDLLFPSTDRDLRQPTSRNTFRTRSWRPAVKAAGLPVGVRMHDLRHAHASWLLAGGADLKTVMDRLGHARIATTQQYLHALADADDTALAAFQRTRDRHRPAEPGWEPDPEPVPPEIDSPGL